MMSSRHRPGRAPAATAAIEALFDRDPLLLPSSAAARPSPTWRQGQQRQPDLLCGGICDDVHPKRFIALGHFGVLHGWVSPSNTMVLVVLWQPRTIDDRFRFAESGHQHHLRTGATPQEYQDESHPLIVSVMAIQQQLHQVMTKPKIKNWPDGARSAPHPTSDHPFFTDCPTNTNYTRGSAFQANLDALLSSLPAAAAASSGFAENVTGAAPDQAYGLAQCRADVNASACRACLDASVKDITSQCPGQKSAMLGYDDCLLRHSNASFIGAVDTSVVMEYWWNPKNTTQQVEYTWAFGALMANLTEMAHASPRMFAASLVALTPPDIIYGMAQCTRDLSAEDCKRCLSSAIEHIPTSRIDIKLGGRVLTRSCSVRFDEYLFYNVTATEAAMSPVPSPGGRPINGSDHFVPGSTGSKRPVRTVLLVSIPAAASLLVFLIVALYLRKRTRKPQRHAQMASVKGHGADEEMRSSQLLLYDLSTLSAATHNFSEESKLGEGGFGPVYKGVLRDGQEIAVKRLSTTSQQGLVEMKNEVALVAKLQHRNLVRLLGCCIEKHEKLLVYEFLSNKSLDKILYAKCCNGELTPIIHGGYEQVWRHWSQGNVSTLLHGSPPDEHWKQEMLRCIHIGLLCVQDNPQLRPRMAVVVLMLNSHSMTLDVPTEPVFTIPGERPWVAAPEPSTNEASISHLEPR
ncbi:hypothetical protein EJB05_36163 [Eragrostis curvula]|uniref:Gnk2-homologous domain-containing protein n=1 Tax=Eragrostis curvula TaxID=38414 RepID=A0A5J9U9M0_9POAL|nr:hypothetical protein EJB05_36163 [Eragrostis curvula]